MDPCIVPASELVVEDKQPFDGPLFVRTDGRRRVLGATLARAMRMRLLPRDPHES